MSRPVALLWMSLAAVLAASWSHVAGTFSTLEAGQPLPVLADLGPYTGLLAAVALDLGLIGLAWGVGARSRAHQPARDLWYGVVLFGLLSALANFDHALTVAGHGMTGAAAWAALDQYARVRLVALSATLPVMSLYLTRVVETSASSGIGHKADKRNALPAPVPADTPRGTQEGTLAGFVPQAGRNGHVTPPAPRKARPGALTAEAYARALRDIPDGTGLAAADAIVGRRLGVSAKTVQRFRLLSAARSLPDV